MRSQTKSWFGRIVVAGSLVLLAGGSFFLADTASATSTPATGVITGKVRECGPGPVVPPQTAAIPAMVVLIHRGRTYESQSIAFPKALPWTGTFSFNVRSGTYQVVSSYQGDVRTVTVKAGSHHVVSFGIIGCAD